MMIPYGYKQTEVGVIPEDWECTTAKQLMKIETGSRNTENKTNTGIYPFFVRSQKIESIDTYHYNCEAVLTAGDGVGTGKVFHYYIGKFDAHQRVYVMSGFNGISGRYFYYYFSENFEKEVSKYTAKSSVDSVRHDMIAEMKIPLPPLPEQQRIAEALSDVDGMISSLEKLIAKYKSIKTACLQQMFPQNGETVPRMRLPGFTGAWEQRKLSELASIHARIGWQNLRTSEFLDSGDYMLITGTDFNDGAINFSTCHYVERERYEQDRNIQIHNGSILITKDGTLGKVAYVQGLSMPATLNAGVFNVQIKDANIVDEKYLFQYLKAPYLMDYVSKKATGGTIKHLNQNILVDFPVVMPKKSEQILIGAYFQQLDSLITFHQRKLEKIQKIKQGMMQQLLTGKIRLV